MSVIDPKRTSGQPSRPSCFELLTRRNLMDLVGNLWHPLSSKQMSISVKVRLLQLAGRRRRLCLFVLSHHARNKLGSGNSFGTSAKRCELSWTGQSNGMCLLEFVVH